MNNFEGKKIERKRMNSSSLAIKICSCIVGRMRDEFQFELFYEKLIKMNHLFTNGCISTHPPSFNILFSLSDESFMSDFMEKLVFGKETAFYF